MQVARRVAVFAVIATPRSGSTHLCGLLDSHPEVLCHYELFHPYEVALSLKFEERLKDTSIRGDDVLGFLDRLLGEHQKRFPALRAIGFKLQLSPIQKAAALEPIATCREIIKIGLDRRNRLAAFASVRSAMASGVWQTQAPVPGLERPSTFDEEQFLRYVNGLDGDWKDVETMLAGQDFLKLDYRDLLRPDVHRGLLTRIGVDPATPLHSDWVKTGAGAPIARFDDPRTVRATLTKLGRPEWLDDVEG